MSGTAGAYPIALNSAIDSSTFVPDYEDKVRRTELEGGYLAVRAKHTRTPRRMWKFSHTFINDTLKDALETFYLTTTAGGSLSFDFTHPTTAEVITVIFVTKPTASYVGIRNTHRWNFSVEIREV